MTTDTIAQALRERITAYLVGGGLFNPELASHDAVRDLLIECRAAIASLSAVEPHTSQQRSHLLRFTTNEDGSYIDDDDFMYDSSLRVEGDFADDATRLSYAQWLCDKLNAFPTPQAGEAP